MISHVDEYVGKLLDRLDEQGLLDNTVVLYTADHGEMAGDHGKFGKTTFFEGSVRVPFIIGGPGVKPGIESDALVETLDVGRTVCDLVGVPTHALDQGRSLVPVLRGETTAHRETVYAEMGCDRMLRTERYKLMWGEPSWDTRKLGRLHLDKPVDVPPSPGALYDLREDPHETRNVLDEPAYRTVRSEMLERLLTRLNENTQARPFLSRGEYRPPAARRDHPAKVG
jgi:arylsulfatase A-like enzyme